jgi:tetratricopeptide (TPR) repeat protein
MSHSPRIVTDKYKNISILSRYFLENINMLAINYRTRVFMVEKTAKVLYNKGVQASEQGLYKEAVSYYKSAIKLDPLFRRAFINLGTIYSKAKKYKKSKNCFLKAYQLADDPSVYFNIASLEYKLGNSKKARQMLLSLLRKDPRHILSHLLLAQIHESAGHTEKAETYLNNVLKIDPDNKKGLSALALFYFDRGRDIDALRVLNTLLEKHPHMTALEEIRASINLKLNNIKSAMKNYQKLSKTDENYLRFTNNLDEMNSQEKMDAFGNLPEKIKGKVKIIKESLVNIKEEKKPVDQKTIKDIMDLSFYYLFNGQPDESLKYLFAAKKLKLDSDNLTSAMNES